MPDWKTEAVFLKKVQEIDELRAHSGYHNPEYALPFRVEKIIQLTDSAYQKFIEDPGSYYRFLYDYNDDMYIDTRSQCWHCLLVKAEDRKEGILIESEGYVYARYAALVPDCSILELKGVEILNEVDISHDIPQDYWEQQSISSSEEKQGIKDKKMHEAER